MKRYLLFSICVLMLSLSAHATNYSVKQSGAGNFTTIQACANTAVAGDTCTVYGGIYDEYPTLSRSGSGTNGACSSCITFTVNPGDVVQVYGFNITGSYINVNGFLITDPSFAGAAQAGVEIHTGTTGVSITNNTITQVGGASATQVSSGYPCVRIEIGTPSATYVTISGNTISWCSALQSQMQTTNPAISGACGTTYPPTSSSGGGSCNSHIGQAINTGSGKYVLIANNDISHASKALSLGSNSSYVVVRGNTYHDSYIGTVDQTAQSGAPPEWDAYNCYEGNLCDTHNDTLNATGGGNTNILLENNTVKNEWGTRGAHLFFASAAAATDTFWISRFNKGYRVGSTYLGNEESTSAPYGVSYWKDYNNSYIFSQQQNAGAPFSLLAGCSATNGGGDHGSLLNDLFYNDANPAGASTTAYYSWSGPYCLTAFNSGHNLAYDSSCRAGRLACTRGQMTTDPGNIYADPRLVATDGSNFSLQSNSPAIASGTYLTTVAASDSGSGTSLVLSDASYFQDGSGIPGVQADYIRVGTSTIVQITSVNYQTNTVSLANSISRSPGDSVNLFKDSSGLTVLFGNSPDIGAQPFGQQQPLPPTNLTVTVS